ncbi:MAG: hypothetical protein SWK76_15220 [Actinomycetota bacterium]|nr:hypothetical protein [Actinomycetota bacterium]
MSTAERARKAVLSCDLLMLAAVLFVVLVTAAVILYPGSDRLDSGTSHYSFSRNFLSELGQTRTFAGQANYPSMVLFIVVVSLVGLALILFGLNHWVVWRERMRGRALVEASLAACVLSGVGFIAIAANPQNLNSTSHVIATRFAFFFLLVYIILLLAMQALNGWDRRLIYANAVYLLLLAAYVALISSGVDMDTESGLVTLVVAQKVVILASIIDLGLQAHGMKKAAAIVMVESKTTK